MAQDESLSAFFAFDSIAKLKPASSGGLWMIWQHDDPCAGFLFHCYSRRLKARRGESGSRPLGYRAVDLWK
jgi:hypothetical protein